MIYHCIVKPDRSMYNNAVTLSYSALALLYSTTPHLQRHNRNVKICGIFIITNVIKWYHVFSPTLESRNFWASSASSKQQFPEK
uniref:Uncharacterized protein n=1 Tax=Anguilla anguilla TaxID=7936 RepID=A0A0E9UVN2_ANGAN